MESRLSLTHLLLVVDHPELGEVLREGGGDAGRGPLRGGPRAATVGGRDKSL